MVWEVGIVGDFLFFITGCKRVGRCRLKSLHKDSRLLLVYWEKEIVKARYNNIFYIEFRLGCGEKVIVLGFFNVKKRMVFWVLKKEGVFDSVNIFIGD